MIGILVIFATLITFSSCNKEAELDVTTTNDEVLERILDFKQKVENPNQQKSGEEISVEDAVWLVEAALNYSYCILDKEVELINNQKDSVRFDINSNNNELLFNDVRNIYFQLTEQVEELNIENKTYLIDVFFENNKIKAKILFGEQNLQKVVPTPYSGFTQEYSYYDAADQIQHRVNRRLSAVSLVRGYFTDVETEFVWSQNDLLRNPESNDPCYMYYYMFYEYSGNIDTNGTWSQTLTVPEMNFYYDGVFITADIMQNYFNIDEEKQFISIDLWWNAMFTAEEYFPIMHEGNFTYGLFHKTPTHHID